MGKSKKQYIGAIEDESEAAQIYDWHAIVTQGIRVRNAYLIVLYRQKQTFHILETSC
jgi:hypothetical protein